MSCGSTLQSPVISLHMSCLQVLVGIGAMADVSRCILCVGGMLQRLCFSALPSSEPPVHSRPPVRAQAALSAVPFFSLRQDPPEFCLARSEISRMMLLPACLKGW